MNRTRVFCGCLKQAFRSMSLLCDSLSRNKSRAIRECTTCIQFYRITFFLADHPSQHLTPTPVFPKQETTTDKRQFFLERLKDLQQMIPISVICHIFFGSFKDVLFFRLCFKNCKITRGNTTLLHSTDFPVFFHSFSQWLRSCFLTWLLHPHWDSGGLAGFSGNTREIIEAKLVGELSFIWIARHFDSVTIWIH